MGAAVIDSKGAPGMRYAIRLVLVVAAFVLFSNRPASAATLTCSTATTLDALANCIKNQIPANGSGEWVAATTTEQTAWRSAVNQMLNGGCNFALPAAIATAAQIRTFTDTSTGKSYCLLMEVLDANNNGKVDRGWGAFMVNANATLEINHTAPHPLADLTTENQSIGVFGGTNARSWMMAGAHRTAASGSSSCQSSYGASDAAHNINNMFHAATIELKAFYGNNDWQQIQWHGMASDTCSTNAFLSHGRDVNPSSGDKNLALKNNMLGYHPTWDIETPDTSCTLNATDNTQGRLINGVPEASVCGTAASSYTGTFLHIEQDPGFRTASDWIPSVNEVWGGGGQTPPPSPANLAATGGNAQVSLSWNPASGADTYSVHRSTVSGGPYGTIASNLTATTHLDTTVTNGTTYYYVVSGVNEAGEGPDSNQASATPSVPQVPAAPTGVTAVSNTKKKITVSWNAVAGATSYTIKRSTTSGGPYTNVGTTSSTSFTNSGLTSGTTYYYVVSASNAQGEGPNSAQVSAVAR
jgi:hypothetical protein